MEVLKQEREARKQALLAQKVRLESELSAIQEREDHKAAQYKTKESTKQEGKKKRKRAKDLTEQFALPDSDDDGEDMEINTNVSTSTSNQQPAKKKRKTKRKKSNAQVPPTESINGIRSASKDFLGQHKHVVYFKNVSFDFGEEELKEFFAPCGVSVCLCSSLLTPRHHQPDFSRHQHQRQVYRHRLCGVRLG